jgi:hypothetical protein
MAVNGFIVASRRRRFMASQAKGLRGEMDFSRCALNCPSINLPSLLWIETFRRAVNDVRFFAGHMPTSNRCLTLQLTFRPAPFGLALRRSGSPSDSSSGSAHTLMTE